DTNVLWSGFANLTSDRSAPAEIIRRWLTGEFELWYSEVIVAELERGLQKPYFAKAFSSQALRPVQTLNLLALRTPISMRVKGVVARVSDALILSTAVSAGADFLVPGAGRLQSVRGIGGVSVTSPAHFFATLAAGKA